MLVNGREEMVRRAERSFQAQTYEQKTLLIYDTSPDDVADLADKAGIPCDDPAIITLESTASDHHGRAKTIGYLRNRANHGAEHASVILHWDSDDWSHANRIAEQVALLQASGKDCVGYREMLFWQQPTEGSLPHGLAEYECECESCIGGAWLYSQSRKHYCVGTSLCYWRRVWERRPFEDLPKPGGGTGEDTKWLEGVSSLGVSAQGGTTAVDGDGIEPRMIATIHWANTNAANYRECLAGNSPQWKRVPEWDARVRAIMEAA